MVLPSGPTIRTSMSRNPPSATSNMRPIFVPDFTCGKSNFLTTSFSVADPGSRIRTINPKKWFLSSRKYDSGCSSRIRILAFYPSQILDPGVKNEPDPGFGSATLTSSIIRYRDCLYCNYSGRGKFMPLPLKRKILETPGSLVTDDIKMFPL
jgi:hypothetical protein